jgi:autotransporter-associated beta strand protein
VLLLAASPAAAQNATWSNSATVAGPVAGTFDFNANANWTSPATVPTGTAFFGTSSTTALSFSGDTTIGGWTFNPGGSSYTFTNGHALQFNGAGIVLSGGGTASITNNNTLSFTNASTAGGATITTNSGASTTFLDNSTGGTARFITNLGGTFDISGLTAAGMSAGSIEGAGSYILGAKALTVGSNNLSANVSGVISGVGGSLTVVGSGPITLSGANTYTGGTTVSGALAVSADNNLGASTGSLVLDGGTLETTATFASARNVAIKNAGGILTDAGVITTLSSSIADGSGIPGALAKYGPGTLILTGNSTYTGETVVLGGSLVVDGSIASSSRVLVMGGNLLTGATNFGMLSGTGVVGATEIANGILAPGNSPGTSLTLASLVLQGLYVVNINPTTSTFANVTGSAQINVTSVEAFFASGSYVAKRYTILNAGSVSGTFNPTVTSVNLPSGFKTSLSYDPTHAFLDLSLDFVPPSGLPPGSGLSGNQQQVGNAIINFFNSNGSIPIVFGGLTPAGLTQISGEAATGSQQTTFNAMGQFMGLLLDPFIDGRGNAPASTTNATPYAEDGDARAYNTSDAKRRSKNERDAYGAVYGKAPMRNTVYDPHWSVWAAGFGGSQTTDGNAALGTNSATSRVFGTAVGADYLLSPRTIVGFTLAGGGTNFSVANGGTGRSDLFQAGAFVKHSAGSVYISGALAYGWQDITTNRTVTVAGIDQLQARFNANAYSGRVEAGNRFVTPWMGGIGITPYAAAQFTNFDLPAYAESVLSGANGFALAYNAKSVTDTRSELGIRADKSYAVTGAILTLRSRFGWAHDFNPDRSIAATFQTLPGASFVVGGAAQAHDSALTTVSGEMRWLNGWSAAATFEGEFSDVTRSYAAKGAVRYAW